MEEEDNNLVHIKDKRTDMQTVWNNYVNSILQTLDMQTKMLYDWHKYKT